MAKQSFIWGTKVIRAGTFSVQLKDGDHFEVTADAMRGGGIPIRSGTGATVESAQSIKYALNHLDQGQLDREGLELVNRTIDSVLAGGGQQPS